MWLVINALIQRRAFPVNSVLVWYKRQSLLWDFVKGFGRIVYDCVSQMEGRSQINDRRVGGRGGRYRSFIYYPLDLPISLFN